MDLTAYALRADLEGTVDVEVDGEKKTVPTFGGAVLAVGDGDFHVADSLKAGKGTIVVQTGDQRLVDLLDAYPPLKRVPVPKRPVVVSRYERKSTDDLRTTASLRDVARAGSATRPALITVLEAYDQAIEDGDLPRAVAIAAAGAGSSEAEEAAPAADQGGTTTTAGDAGSEA